MNTRRRNMYRVHVSRPSICKVYLRVLWQWPCCSGRRRPSYPLYNNTHIHHEYATVFFFFLYIKYILLHSSFLFYLFFFFLSIFIFFIQKDLETSQRAFFNIQLSWYLLLFFLFLYFLVIFRFEWIREQRSFGNFAIYVWFYV